MLKSSENIKHIFKSSRKDLFKYLIKSLNDDSQVIQNISLKNEKSLEIMDDVFLKMNEIMFHQDSPEDVVEIMECCKIKLYEVASIMKENKDEFNLIYDDLKTSKFLIDCNMEEDSFEL